MFVSAIDFPAHCPTLCPAHHAPRASLSYLRALRLPRHRCSSSRHPDLVNPAPVVVTPRPDIEGDARYCRADMSSLFAYSARWRLAQNIARGEPGMNLAEAALLVAAEDDAIASHSTVAFPIEPYLARIQKLADEFELQRLQPSRRAAAEAPSAAAASSTPAAILQQLEDFLFQEQRISVPPFGRSNLPPNTLLDHPGVWEDARWGYLNELLIRKKGHSAAVAILVAEIMRRLLSRGSLDFAVAMDVRGFAGLPKAVVLPGITRGMLLDPTRQPLRPGGRGGLSTYAEPPAPAEGAAAPGAAQQPLAGVQDAGVSGRQQGGASSSSSGGPGPQALPGSGEAGGGLFALNTCTSDALAELLRHLKRSYWPLPWDTNVDAYADGGNGSHGGFKAAAKAGSGDEMSAQLRAVSTVANWRLERGVWTSPGAGDIRRCRAACERLVLLGGEQQDEERRDLAVLLLHSGELAAARAELGAYMDSQHFRLSADGIDKVLCKKMMQMLQQVKSLEAPRPLTLEGFLAGPSPEEVKFHDRKMPLTW